MKWYIPIKPKTKQGLRSGLVMFKNTHVKTKLLY